LIEDLQNEMKSGATSLARQKPSIKTKHLNPKVLMRWLTKIGKNNFKKPQRITHERISCSKKMTHF